ERRQRPHRAEHQRQEQARAPADAIVVLAAERLELVAFGGALVVGALGGGDALGQRRGRRRQRRQERRRRLGIVGGDLVLDHRRHRRLEAARAARLVGGARLRL